MQYAVWLIEHRRRVEARRWIIITIIMGTLFRLEPGDRVDAPRNALVHQLVRFEVFFITTGLHGLHVILGLVAMSFLLFRMRGTEGDPGELSTFRGNELLLALQLRTLVWIGLYSALFLLK